MSAGSDTTIETDEIERIFLGFAVEAKKQITEEYLTPKKKVLVLSGPTGAGKSEFVLELAKQIGGEVVNADSMQVYKGMDIGTAKLPSEKREGVPHHLIDIRNLDENYNVVDFYYEARQCCQEILDREGVPIIVGGSGFYVHALIYGPPSGPPSVPEIRERLEAEIERFGIEAVFEKLRKLDPQYASTITKNDKQKIIRALEIIQLSGKPVSMHLWRKSGRPKNFDFRCWFLHRPKTSLYKRIDQRCIEMLEKGFLDEVKWLMGEGLVENVSASQAIGYRQALEYLQSPQTDEDYRYFVKEFQKASRRYAKRQFTWFKKEELFRWMDLDLHDPEVAREIIRQDCEGGR